MALLLLHFLSSVIAVDVVVVDANVVAIIDAAANLVEVFALAATITLLLSFLWLAIIVLLCYLVVVAIVRC